MAGWMWWVVVLVLIGAEMLTGTFYLLALALAFAAGGLVDWFGGTWVMELVAAALVGTIGCFGAYFYQQKRRREQKEEPQSLDIGQRVVVLQWNADGSARVQYRGSQWDAVAASPTTEHKNEMVIAEVRGSMLVITDAPLVV